MKNHFIYLCFTFFFALLQSFISVTASNYGILASETSTEKENFCIIYFKEFSSLPAVKSDADFYILQDDSDIDWCDDHPETDIKNKVLLLSNNNCSVSTQALNIYNRGAEGILFITASEDVDNIKVNASAAQGINMSVALISKNSAKKLKTMYPGVSVCLYAPGMEKFDYSLLVIFILSMFTIIVGAYWSGVIRYQIYCKEVDAAQGSLVERQNQPSVSRRPNDESSINISPANIVCVVITMGLMLVILYFFLSYLIYFIIGLFVFASIIAVYCVFEPLVLKIKLDFCRVQLPCGSRKCDLDFRQILLFGFAIGICAYWVVIRNESNAWVLQCLLGIAFCIHMLKTIRLPSFKICTCLLVLLFFYDIFFVFITPYLTGKSESIMEKVATGGESEEMIPMLIKVPHIGSDPMTLCYQQYSLLGFGDILVPGLLVSYCHGFDLITSKRRIYFFTTVFTYALGLIITGISLVFMNTAQPALLYLVPFTVLPPLILAYFRKELPALWNGFKALKANASDPELPIGANSLSPKSHDNITSTISVKPDASLDCDNRTHNETNQLLR